MVNSGSLTFHFIGTNILLFLVAVLEEVTILLLSWHLSGYLVCCKEKKKSSMGRLFMLIKNRFRIINDPAYS